ncbi:hypothetical protein EZS27_002512 [termite gut metagenome]|uniref:Clostripain n=1 Tax=termite gut metagenome TaxID=433724 RepID=A0A5J4SVT7_9ZZZZ
MLYLPILFGFGSCEKEEPELPLKGRRTVLAYLAADNSLSSFSEEDINEMMEGVMELKDEADRLIVYVDNNYGYESQPQLFRLKRDKTGTVVKEVIGTYEKQNSASVKVMKEVLLQAFGNFPAASYGLVLWSHGDGWAPSDNQGLSFSLSRSFGQDGSTKMDISDLHEVLKDYHFDFVLFDACFMQSVEVVYELRDCSDYFIGSPTEIPGPGAPYQTLVESMFSDKNTVALDIAKAYHGYYAAIYNNGINNSNTKWTGGVSVSVVKSDELEQLAIATKYIFSGYLSEQIPIDVSTIMCYDRRVEKLYYYDMDGFIGALTERNADYAVWQAAYQRTVLYYETTSNNYSAKINGMFSMEGSQGLSIYIPKKNLTSINSFYSSYAWYTAAGWDETGLFQ